MIKPILLTFTCVALAATVAFAAQQESGAPPTDPQIAMIAVTANTVKRHCLDLAETRLR